MSKELRAFRDGEDRRIINAAMKVGGRWAYAETIYRKEGGTWVEWWPLSPDPPGAVTGVFTYRNDRIELDINFNAPSTGADVDHFQVEVMVGAGLATYDYIRADDSAFTPDQAWQQHSGQLALITVRGVSPTGMEGRSERSAWIQVPNLPAPPPPSPVSLSISNALLGTLSWGHVGGNRLSHFEAHLSYNGRSSDFNATLLARGPTARSLDVTTWNTNPQPGDPGGQIGVLIRAVGPGGYSDWANTSGTISPIPVENEPPPPGKTDPPPPQPEPDIALPGRPVITNHRFLNGRLTCDYTCANATGVDVSWQKYPSETTINTGQGASGTVTIASSDGFPRDKTRYRIVLRGKNAQGDRGATAYGPWARKMYNPFRLSPPGWACYRGNTDLKEFGFYDMRQGASYNEFNYLNPVIIWASYFMYRKTGTQSLDPAYVGYQVRVKSANLLLGRLSTGGSAGSVRPRIWMHSYGDTTNVGSSRVGGWDGPPMARGAGNNFALPPAYIQRLIDPNHSYKGVTMYSPDHDLHGQVSSTYMRMRNPYETYLGMPYWTIQIEHDG